MLLQAPVEEQGPVWAWGGSSVGSVGVSLLDLPLAVWLGPQLIPPTPQLLSVHKVLPIDPEARPASCRALPLHVPEDPPLPGPQGAVVMGTQGLLSCLLSNGTPRPVTVATASTKQSVMGMGMGTGSLPFSEDFPLRRAGNTAIFAPRWEPLGLRFSSGGSLPLSYTARSSSKGPRGPSVARGGGGGHLKALQRVWGSRLPLLPQWGVGATPPNSEASQIPQPQQEPTGCGPSMAALKSNLLSWP